MCVGHGIRIGINSEGQGSHEERGSLGLGEASAVFEILKRLLESVLYLPGVTMKLIHHDPQDHTRMAQEMPNDLVRIDLRLICARYLAVLSQDCPY